MTPNLQEERCPHHSQIPEERCPRHSQIPEERCPHRSQIPEERRPRRSKKTRYLHFRNYFGKEIKYKRRLTRRSTVLCSQLIFLSQLSFSAVLFFRKQAIVLSGFPLLKCSRFPLDDSSSNNSVPGLVLIPYL